MKKECRLKKKKRCEDKSVLLLKLKDNELKNYGRVSHSDRNVEVCMFV